MTKSKDWVKPVWAIFSIGFGLMLLVSGTEWYQYLIALLGFTSGGVTLYRNHQDKKNRLKPICEFCGYVALDERELHNHQITCVKKPNS